MRVIAGPEKKTRLLSEHERKVTAYHEMGHALVGHYLPNCDAVHKISIISRGAALGYTISLPAEDKFLTTKSALMDQMAMTLGGRAAEELVFHEVTTGAANDIEKVTATSKHMVMRYGMSEKLGPRMLGRNHDMPFLGRDMGAEPDYSEEIAREIDDEIRRVIEEAHDRARKVLAEHMDELHKLSALLIERETIDKDQFERLLAGESSETVFPEPRGRARGGGRGREEAARRAQAAPVPAPGRDDAAPARARGRQLASSRVEPTARHFLLARRLTSAARPIARSPLWRYGRRIRLPVRPPLEQAFPRPAVVGVVNVTPDSFSDGGRYLAAGGGLGARARVTSTRARRSSTSAASRPGPAPTACPPRRSFAASSPCWSG